MLKKYNIIYIDPPWKYNNRNNIKTKFGLGCNIYETMSFDDIKLLPLDKMSDENCALFMWCTFPFLEKQIKLFKHWGFEYKTIGFNWIKTNKNNNKPFFGVGYYTKSNSELCLLGIKGKMKPISNNISSIIISEKEKHSKKPDVIREKIVELFGDLPKCEIFARNTNENWDCFGNEITGNDIFIDLNKYMI